MALGLSGRASGSWAVGCPAAARSPQNQEGHLRWRADPGGRSPHRPIRPNLEMQRALLRPCTCVLRPRACVCCASPQAPPLSAAGVKSPLIPPPAARDVYLELRQSPRLVLRARPRPVSAPTPLHPLPIQGHRRTRPLFNPPRRRPPGSPGSDSSSHPDQPHLQGGMGAADTTSPGPIYIQV